MKRILTLLLAVGLCSFLHAQSSGTWFTVKEVGPKVWQISDHGADNMYLVEGRDSAMLIDNGLGTADIVSFIRKISSKPLIVVITHGHPDHAGSDYQFAKVYIHPADSAAARQYNDPSTRARSSSTMTGDNKPSPGEMYKGEIYNTITIPVSDGKVFDLGGRRIEVISTPGHTPGEIVLLDISNKLLFSGDNNNSLVWLFLGNCLPLHKYLASLEKQAARLQEFTTILPGHGDPIPATFILDQISCVNGILDGSLERKPYQSFAGNAMVATFGEASVAFNPGNL
jgi:hydroxyacylglutathione hydrolase